jgi:hypothetical protein
MITCPYCESELDDQLNFCANCEKQVRCLACRNRLYPSKTRCLICGTSVAATPTPMFNEYWLEEETKDGSAKRRVHLKMSDAAMGVVGEHPDRYLQPWSQAELITNPQVRVPALPALQAKSDSTPLDDIEATDEGTTSLATDDDKYQWADIFVVKVDDDIEIKRQDFKGLNKQDQQRRLVLLYVWGYRRLMGHATPSRKSLTKAAKHLGYYDSNFSHIVTTMTRESLIETKDGISLSPEACKQVDQILSEMRDEGKPGWVLRGPKPRGSGGKGKKSENALETIEARVKEWCSRDIDLAGFEVRTLHDAKARTKIEFGLWILKKKLNIEMASVNAVISFLAQKFPAIGGKPESLRNGATAKEYISRSAQSECVLTIKGEAEIEAILPDELKATR